MVKKFELSIPRRLDVSDLQAAVIDSLANCVEADRSVALRIAACSAPRKTPVVLALCIFGDHSLRESIKPLRSLTEAPKVIKDNGAKRALIRIKNKRVFLDVNAGVIEQGGPIFFEDTKNAEMNVLKG